MELTKHALRLGSRLPGQEPGPEPERCDQPNWKISRTADPTEDPPERCEDCHREFVPMEVRVEKFDEADVLLCLVCLPKRQKLQRREALVEFGRNGV